MPVEKRVSAAPMKLVCGEPGHAPIGEVSVPVEEVDGEGSVKLQLACGAGRGGERGVGYRQIMRRMVVKISRLM